MARSSDPQRVSISYLQSFFWAEEAGLRDCLSSLLAHCRWRFAINLGDSLYCFIAIFTTLVPKFWERLNLRIAFHNVTPLGRFFKGHVGQSYGISGQLHSRTFSLIKSDYTRDVHGTSRGLYRCSSIKRGVPSCTCNKKKREQVSLQPLDRLVFNLSWSRNQMKAFTRLKEGTNSSSEKARCTEYLQTWAVLRARSAFWET